MGINHQIRRADAQKSVKAESPTVGDAEKVEIKSSAVPEPSPKPKGGRPSTGFDKKAYMSAFMRDKRKADKLGLKVSEYRKKYTGSEIQVEVITYLNKDGTIDMERHYRETQKELRKMKGNE